MTIVEIVQNEFPFSRRFEFTLQWWNQIELPTASIVAEKFKNNKFLYTWSTFFFKLKMIFFL